MWYFNILRFLRQSPCQHRLPVPRRAEEEDPARRGEEAGEELGPGEDSSFKAIPTIIKQKENCELHTFSEERRLF